MKVQQLGMVNHQGAVNPPDTENDFVVVQAIYVHKGERDGTKIEFQHR